MGGVHQLDRHLVLAGGIPPMSTVLLSLESAEAVFSPACAVAPAL
jgi:hypothetical protein